MHDDRALVEARIRRALSERVLPALHHPGVPLDVSAYAPAGEPLSLAEAESGEFVPFPIGDRFGVPWSTTWFRVRAEVPQAWAGLPVDALIEFSSGPLPGFSAEGLVWSAGEPLQGLHRDHRRVPVGRPAAGGEVVDLLVEAAANPDLVVSFAPTPMGDTETAPPVALYRLTRAELAPFNEQVWHLWLDLRLLTELMQQLRLDDGRRHDILRAMERAVGALDLVDVAATADAARAELSGVLNRPAHASAHRVSAIGHAHLDTAWLWPIRETHRKVARTFANALQLMDEYPEYRFGASQAQQFDWLRTDHPALFERVRARVADGRIVPLGGMWVEADGNLPSGESLVRQFLYGKRFFAEEFRVEPREVWIPDVFGYPASLPQIFAKAGCTRFVTQKMSWNDTNRFPHHTFVWEGIDGSRVLTHFPPADTYNGSMQPSELVKGARQFAEHGRAELSLYPFGHGDGGGGPTREMLELARRQADLEGVPRVQIESPAEFFERVEALDPNPPEWVGELYFEKHRGTLTTQARTKHGNRRGEWLLREAELWSTMAGAASGVASTADLEALWKSLLLQQFHDILPGSGIAWVHRDAEAAHVQIAAEAEQWIAAALKVLVAGIAAPIALANPLTHDRAEVCVLDEQHATPLRDLGTEGLVQELTDGRVALWVSVPGCGVAAARPGVAPDAVVATTGRIENGALAVEVDGDGFLTSVFDKVAEREVILAGSRANVLTLRPDHPNEFDAWDIDRHVFAGGDVLEAAEVVRVVEEGPLVGSIRVVRVFGGSRVVQEYTLRAGSARLDIVTEIDWHEDEKLLDASFPVDVRALEAHYEIQFGSVARPTHRNTSWDWAQFEVCAHSWIDLAEPDFGVALLNDAKYGHEVAGNVMRITLLRAPGYPDPGADRGRHRFTYSLLPHRGDRREGGVVAEAHTLNVPLRAVPVASPGEDRARQFVRVDHPGVVVSAVKLAEDGSGDVILRAYEAWGQRAHVHVALDRPVASAHECDLLERPQRRLPASGDAVEARLRPFEILTVRVSTLPKDVP